MDFKKVVVAGGGVLGSQIGYQTAFKGFDTTFLLRSEGSIERTKAKIENLYRTYLAELEALSQKKVSCPRGFLENPEELNEEKIEELKANAKSAYENIKYSTDKADALKDADIVIESMAEKPDAKIEFYESIAEYLPEKTILVTNSSTLLPSTFAEYTKRPEKYLSLHFANQIWRNNTAEVMGQSKTNPEIFKAVSEFAKKIGMIPLELKKEQPGYLLNSLLVPLLNSAQALLVNGVSDAETIDKAWTLGTGAPFGPFRILDVVGLETAYNIVSNDPRAKDPETLPGKIASMLKSYIDEGKTGIAAGEGFYKYR